MGSLILRKLLWSELEALKKMSQTEEIQSQAFFIPSGHFRF